MAEKPAEKLIVACPSCDTKNAVPAARLADRGKCGHCGKPLFQSHPMALTEAHFQQAAAGLEPRVRLAKVDTESEQGLGERFGIRSIPTLIVFHKGKEIARQ